MRKSAACNVCSRPIDVHHSVRGGTCGDMACRAVAVKRRIAQERAAREAAKRAIATAHLPELLVGRPERTTDVALVVLTAAATALEPVPAARREALRESVAQAVAASAEPESDVGSAELRSTGIAPHPPAVAAVCAACRGYCCRRGSDSGYIHAGTVRRVRERRPHLGPEELVALYVDAVPEHSVAGSCIFHGARGCALPRELRAQICNTYFCPPLRQWLDRPAEAAGQPTAAVVLEGGQVVRSALIE